MIKGLLCASLNIFFRHNGFNNCLHSLFFNSDSLPLRNTRVTIVCEDIEVLIGIDNGYDHIMMEIGNAGDYYFLVVGFRVRAETRLHMFNYIYKEKIISHPKSQKKLSKEIFTINSEKG